MKNIKIIKTADEMRALSFQWKKEGHKVGFVPTMGFLHEGHLTLLERAKEKSGKVVLSIFVNPTQFGEGEDFDDYPRDLERDVELAATKGIDAVFFPPVDEMYPENYQTFVELEKLPDFLCGKSRDGHFRGVSTVVTKLFNIVCPDSAFFGEKDFQQLAIIRQMTKDLNFGIEIVGVGIVREKDGLAKSSRNTYLSAEERENSVLLFKSLNIADEMVKKGEKSASVIKETATQTILSYKNAKIDYINICNPETLEDVDVIDGPVLMAMAVYMGKTRLIDNMIIKS